MVDIETRRKQVRDCQRRRRSEAKQAGLCCVCCKNKPTPGRVTCENCRKMIRGKHDLV